ncbi:helix-turn-helix domain-containing protein [Streptomyces virginiae]|uniref:Helix-turn-helix transcriptional regulator n=1 Tax=Streptomyces virginiae TaxID=1961 RepID=A0ABZ1TLK6_STRVG|nr:helix-turn-helix domain-containing protein [Streptomyces virginiae]
MAPDAKPPPAPAWRPDSAWRQPPLFEQIPRHFDRLNTSDADLAGPWQAWAKCLAHRFAEARGRGRNIRFAVNRGLAIVLTGHVEGDVIRHTEIFSPLRALDLPIGHIITVLEGKGFVDRTVYPAVPPHVEYALTALGHSVAEPLAHLRNWVENHLDEIQALDPA